MHNEQRRKLRDSITQLVQAFTAETGRGVAYIYLNPRETSSAPPSFEYDDTEIILVSEAKADALEWD